MTAPWSSSTFTPPRAPWTLEDRVMAVRASFLLYHGFPSDLCGACAKASMALRLFLGESAVLVVGEVMFRAPGCRTRWAEHAWLELESHVVDATATQFGLQSFIHVPCEELYVEPWNPLEPSIERSVRYEPRLRGESAHGEVMDWDYVVRRPPGVYARTALRILRGDPMPVQLRRSWRRHVRHNGSLTVPFEIAPLVKPLLEGML